MSKVRLTRASGLGPELALALRAAERGAEIARRGWDEAVVVERKSAGDFVSRIDREADSAIAEVLAHSDVRIVSEELHPLDEGEPLPDDCWIVDPLDGSNAYLTGAQPEVVSSMIALRVGGETLCCALHFVQTDEVFYAVRGQGAYRGEHRLEKPPELGLDEAWVALNHYGDRGLETPRFRAIAEALRGPTGAMLVTVEPACSGHALRMLGGRQRLGAMLHDNNPAQRKQEIWDVVPPQLILEEAGCVFLDAAGERYRPESCELVLAARSQALADAILALA